MKNYDNYPDEELIRMRQQGDREIEPYLIDKYKSLVRKKAHTLYLMGGETDDLIQEGMIGLFQAVRDYSEEKKASFVTFANLCIDRQLYRAIQMSNRQKHQPLNTYVSLSRDPENAADGMHRLWQDDPESIVIDKENAQIVQQKIRERLSPLERQVMDLYLEGRNYTEIAEILGKSPKSIDNAIQRMRGKGREFLQKIY
ncbi:MAG: sigma-70 family RNA polymerase sigma factor [Lachnospiraceae bacterium]